MNISYNLLRVNIIFACDREKDFLQRVSIACYAEHCTSYSKSVRPSLWLSVCLSVCPPVRQSHAVTVSKRLKLYDHAVFTGR